MRIAGLEETLPRGRFLILGGDEVYPTASTSQYEERFVAPYEAASAKHVTSNPLPDTWAIPGNHDWYGGLTAFSRLFFQQRTIGRWQTRQSRSYFALKLPQRWWLWAVDTQLESDIDTAQREFFRRVANKMEKGDGLILCTAEPDWVYSACYENYDYGNNLRFLRNKVYRSKPGIVVPGPVDPGRDES